MRIKGSDIWYLLHSDELEARSKKWVGYECKIGHTFGLLKLGKGCTGVLYAIYSTFAQI